MLVSSTRAERIGYLDDPYILPCVGNDAYGPTPCGELALPLEGCEMPFFWIFFFIVSLIFCVVYVRVDVVGGIELSFFFLFLAY